MSFIDKVDMQKKNPLIVDEHGYSIEAISDTQLILLDSTVPSKPISVKKDDFMKYFATILLEI